MNPWVAAGLVIEGWVAFTAVVLATVWYGVRRAFRRPDAPQVESGMGRGWFAAVYGVGFGAAFAFNGYLVSVQVAGLGWAAEVPAVVAVPVLAAQLVPLAARWGAGLWSATRVPSDHAVEPAGPV